MKCLLVEKSLDFPAFSTWSEGTASMSLMDSANRMWDAELDC